MLAVEKGHLKVVNLFLETGANPQQALVDAARYAASKGHMAVWACIALEVQGRYPEAFRQCVAGMDVVAATLALATGWNADRKGEVDRHKEILLAARQEVQQLIIGTALMQRSVAGAAHQ
jgi:hypothetical protein